MKRKNIVTVEGHILRGLHLHSEIMARLEQPTAYNPHGLTRTEASREALRRLQDKKFKFDQWRDYFTAVELEGFSLPHN